MPYCTRCGNAVASGVQFCQGCGTVAGQGPAGSPTAPSHGPAPAPFPSWLLVILLVMFAAHPESIEVGARRLVLSVDSVAESVGRAAVSLFDVQNIATAYSAVVSLLARLSGNL